jgi:hypothetical protein
MLHAGNTGVGYLIKKYKKTWFVVALLSAILVLSTVCLSIVVLSKVCVCHM